VGREKGDEKMTGEHRFLKPTCQLREKANSYQLLIITVQDNIFTISSNYLEGLE
jgi:hypothetical protein